MWTVEPTARAVVAASLLACMGCSDGPDVSDAFSVEPDEVRGVVGGPAVEITMRTFVQTETFGVENDCSFAEGDRGILQAVTSADVRSALSAAPISPRDSDGFAVEVSSDDTRFDFDVHVGLRCAAAGTATYECAPRRSVGADRFTIVCEEPGPTGDGGMDGGVDAGPGEVDAGGEDVGACCDGTLCAETTAADCGGELRAGASCDPNPCAPATVPEYTVIFGEVEELGDGCVQADSTAELLLADYTLPAFSPEVTAALSVHLIPPGSSGSITVKPYSQGEAPFEEGPSVTFDFSTNQLVVAGNDRILTEAAFDSAALELNLGVIFAQEALQLVATLDDGTEEIARATADESEFPLEVPGDGFGIILRGIVLCGVRVSTPSAP